MKKALFISSLLLILLLLVISELPIKQVRASEITKKDIGRKVRIKGMIDKVEINQKSISIHLKDIEVEIIVFTQESLKLKQEQEIAIEGKVDSYKDNLQVIASKITAISN